MNQKRVIERRDTNDNPVALPLALHAEKMHKSGDSGTDVDHANHIIDSARELLTAEGQVPRGVIAFTLTTAEKGINIQGGMSGDALTLSLLFDYLVNELQRTASQSQLEALLADMDANIVNENQRVVVVDARSGDPIIVADTAAEVIDIVDGTRRARGPEGKRGLLELIQDYLTDTCDCPHHRAVRQARGIAQAELNRVRDQGNDDGN